MADLAVGGHPTTSRVRSSHGGMACAVRVADVPRFHWVRRSWWG